jgi:hypothetical protein
MDCEGNETKYSVQNYWVLLSVIHHRQNPLEPPKI